MKVWLPSIRAHSGADVYVERLARGLRARGAAPVIQWLPHAFQYAPWALAYLTPPANTDVIDAGSWNAFAFRRHRIPLVATVLHCVAGRGYPQWKSWAQAIFHDQMVRRFERASLRAASATITISDSTAREVREDYGVANTRVIPLWIDAGVFSPGSRTRAAGPGITRVLIVGNLTRRKGGDLIRPFCGALGPGFDVTVVTGLRAGALPRPGSCATLHFVSRLSQVQLVDAYRDADIVVSLSRHEGFGYTALEGMACGKPVVAFDASGLRDVIADGETGLLAPVGAIDALAEHCRRLRDDRDLAQRLGGQGRVRAVTVFAEERAIDAHLQLYSGLLSARETHA